MHYFSFEKKLFTKCFSILTFALLTGCSFFSTGYEDESEGVKNSSTASGSSFSVSDDSKFYIELSDSGSKISSDNSSWQDISTSKIKFSSDSDSTSLVKIDYDTYDGENTGLVKIDLSDFSSDAALYFSGSLTSGGVKIQTNSAYEVGVYLDSVSISSSCFPCLEITKGGAASVFLTGENTFIDGRSYGTGYGEEFSTSSTDTYQDDDGNTVTCTKTASAVRKGSNAKGSLFCKGDMTISGSGSLSVTQSYKNCIASKSNLTIESGTYILSSPAGKSGFSSSADFLMKGGNVTFTGKGAISSSECRKAHGINVDDESGTYSATIDGGSLSITSYNGKGIIAPKIYINGGEISVNVTGVSGYTSEDNRRGSWTDADGVSESGTVTFAPEGIEAESLIQIQGGTLEITAQDDGINASDDGKVNISGGKVYVSSSNGDAIDSNGSITITGGTVFALASMGSENAFDVDSSLVIKGGYIAGLAGSSTYEGSSSLTSQVVLALGSSYASAGGNFVIKDSSSNVVYALTIPSMSSLGLLTLSSPNFTAGETYTIYNSASISGGSSFHGLYTSMPSMSSGTSSSSISTKSGTYNYTLGSSGGMSGGGGPGGNMGGGPGGNF